MPDRTKQNDTFDTDSSSAPDSGSKGRGPQGIDKAPGEETSQDNDQVTQTTQRGKNKVDGDPDKPSDQPVNPE